MNSAIVILAAALSVEAPFGRLTVTVPEFATREFSIAEYGARPDGPKCTAAFAAAMRSCEAAGGGRVVVPAGRWVTGAVRFRSNCNLHLAEGAVLVFTDDPADYPEAFTTWEGIECYNHSPLLYAFGCTNVAITGRGLIAPKMDLWRNVWFKRPPSHMKATERLYHWCSTNAPVAARRLLALEDAHMRPHLIQFNRCANVLLDGFRIRESPFWMIHLYHSENCVVRNLETYAHGHNNDGVDVDMTRNVLIEKCRFDQGDDGIVLKAGRNADAWRLNRPTENVVIRDCELCSSHSLLGIGSELSGGIRNVWMTRCRVAKTFNMLRIKTGRRRGGFVENVWLDHCEAEDVRSVFNLFTKYCAQWGAFPDYEIRYTRIRNINVSDCTCARARTAILLEGEPRLPASGITIRNVTVGEVTEKLTDVSQCRDVKIEGLRLGGDRVGVDRAFLNELLSLATPTADVAANNRAVRFVKSHLEGKGLACTTFVSPKGRESLLASAVPGKAADVLFVSHLDVVPAANPAQYVPRLEGDELVARGACDTKGNVAVICAVLAECAGKASVAAFFATDEEGGPPEGGDATPQIALAAGVRPRRLIIVGDSAGEETDQLFTAEKGHAKIVVTAHGRGGHSSRPWALDNPVPKLVAGWAKAMAAMPPPPTAEDKWRDCLSPTMLKAGAAANQIADTAEMTCSLRFTESGGHLRWLEFLRRTTGLDVRCLPKVREPVVTDPANPTVQNLLSALRRRIPRLKTGRMSAATDASYFASLRIPTVIFAADGKGPHGADERVSLASLDAYAAGFADFLRALKFE